jgi:hypothetical protein
MEDRRSRKGGGTVDWVEVRVVHHRWIVCARDTWAGKQSFAALGGSEAALSHFYSIILSCRVTNHC